MSKLTLKLAKEEVEKIKDLALNDDDPGAHCAEDGLYISFANCVADDMYTIEEAKEIAETIKQTQEFEFSRWYD